MTESTPLADQLRALLVEDSPVNQELMARMLESMGCCVTLAKNGREAVTKYVDGQFDLVLMDVQMPVMDGIAATQIIRQHEGCSGVRTPIIAVTAGFDRETCIEAGMDDHLLKPVKSETLRCAIGRATGPGAKGPGARGHEATGHEATGPGAQTPDDH